MKRYLVGLLAALLCLSACTADGPDGAGLCLTETDPAPEAGTVSSAGEELSTAAEAPFCPLTQPASVWEVDGDVTLSLLQDTYPAGTTELTMVLENRGDHALQYGAYLLYERYEGGQWTAAAPGRDAAFDAIAYVLQPHSMDAFTMDAGFLEEPLAPGLYRVTGSALCALDEQGQLVEEYPAYQLEFLVTEGASSEPDYAVFVSSRPVSPEEERIPVYLLNTTGEDASVLFIPSLERESGDGTWSEVPFARQVGFCGTYDPLPAGGRSWGESPEMLWGELEEGRYRLSYTVTDSAGNEHTASGAFTIDRELCVLPIADAVE